MSTGSSSCPPPSPCTSVHRSPDGAAPWARHCRRPRPELSGGEAQRLRLSTGLSKRRPGSLYVFDEPSIGLHPRDVRTLLGVLDQLLDLGATVVVIDHDLDVIANADHVIDMGPGAGPGAGPDGGRIVAQGTPAQLMRNQDSRTGHWLERHLGDHVGDASSG
ncbi:hypothetical protein [Streptomyces sp. NPDC051776]|uniref:hypothetical protein n=1 Tax=Streptomyces sp. NPDC051776 TaxID=3155414 RepID=UPI00343BEA4F